MSKVIAFYGSPSSGKTTIAFRCAFELALKLGKDRPVIFLSPDISVPTLALLFPNYKIEENDSLSKILDKPSIDRDSILEHSVYLKTMSNFLCLGFKAGETRFSYPEPTDEKINDFYSVLQDLADYIFVDCSSDANDKLSQKAKNHADEIVRVVSPDIKGETWLKSDIPPELPDGRNIINVVNTIYNDDYYPTEEICTMLSAPIISLPYSRSLKTMMFHGTIDSKHADRNYTKRMSSLLSYITEDKTNE